MREAHPRSIRWGARRTLTLVVAVGVAATCGLAALTRRRTAEHPITVGADRALRQAEAVRVPGDPLDWLFGDAPRRTIHGAVLRRGVPVPGARVQLRTFRSQLEAGPTQETFSDRLGRFSFSGADPTGTAIRASIGDEEDVAWIDPSDRSYPSERVVLSLRPCSRVRARVIDEAGRGIGDVPITRMIGSPWWFPPGPVSIPTGRSGPAGAFTACVGGVTFLGGGEFERVYLDDALEGGVVTLFPQATLTGTVRDVRGRPLPGAVVQLDVRRGEREIDPIVTDASGRWTAKVPPACRSLRAHWHGRWIESVDVCVAAGHSATLDVAVPDCDHALSGVARVGSRPAAGITIRDQWVGKRLTDASGRFDFGCLEGWSLSADGFGPATAFDVASRETPIAVDLVPGCLVSGRVWQGGRLVAGARMEIYGDEQRTWLDGSYQRILRPGSYDVTLTDPDRIWSRTLSLEVPRCSAITRDLSFPTGDVITGVVVDDWNLPVADVNLVLLHAGSRGVVRLQEDTTSTDGTFVFPGVQPVPYEIAVEPGIGIVPAESRRVPVPSIDRTVRIVYSRPGVDLSGKLVDAAGRPVPHARVAPSWDRGPSTLTRRDGTFVLLRVPVDRGLVDLAYWSADGALYCDVEVPPDRPVTLRLGSPPQSCRPAPPLGGRIY